jgi:hypothetical protein
MMTEKQCFNDESQELSYAKNASVIDTWNSSKKQD